MFAYITNLWNDYGFEIILGICVVFILIYGLYCKLKGRKGTYQPISNSKYFFHQISPLLTRQRQQPHRKTLTNSRGELECRRVLQWLFKRPFNKARPDFLRNPVTGGDFNLELDCFEPELRIAVEYNGIQHYQYIPYFHKNKEAFLNQKYRDQMKRTLCRDNNILLIEVPHTVKLEDIKEFIEKELRRNGVNF